MARAFTRSLFCAVFACVWTVTALTGTARAQSVGVTVGSTGIGGEVGFDVSPMFGLRALGAYFPYSHSLTPSNITYDGDLRLMSFGAAADFYLFDSGLRLTGGAYLNRNRIDVKGTPNGTVTIGNTALRRRRWVPSPAE
jgi:hypothetical protein